MMGELITADWKNNYVVDDCSKFAAAVYYHYLNNTLLKDKNKLDKDAYGIDLWTTGSYQFYSENGKIEKILNSTNLFELWTLGKIKNKNKDGEKFELKPGDLIYRSGDKLMQGHVEFYIGNNKAVGWGEINPDYYKIKNFEVKDEGIYSNYKKETNYPYISVIRIKE